MRDLLYKFVPAASGLLLGWFLFSPPSRPTALGPLAYVVNAGLCFALLLSVVTLVIVGNLPERFERLGFRPAGPPLEVKIAPAATMLGFVHEKEPIYATVFRTGTSPAKTSYDFVSILHGDRGGLTTNADPAGAVLPAGSGSMRQVFPGATIEDLYRRHLEGLSYLAERGVPALPVSEGTFRQDVQMAIRRQRETYLAAPVTGTLVTLWRAATKQVPFVGDLREQKVAGQQIERLLAG